MNIKRQPKKAPGKLRLNILLMNFDPLFCFIYYSGRNSISADVRQTSLTAQNKRKISFNLIKISPKGRKYPTNVVSFRYKAF